MNVPRFLSVSKVVETKLWIWDYKFQWDFKSKAEVLEFAVFHYSLSIVSWLFYKECAALWVPSEEYESSFSTDGSDTFDGEK